MVVASFHYSILPKNNNNRKLNNINYKRRELELLTKRDVSMINVNIKIEKIKPKNNKINK